MRLDKWLWTSRFFKTRALAVKSCELGRVECNGQPAKASRELRIADKLQLKIDTSIFHIEVLLLSEMRGPASVAQTLYCETDQSRDSRLKLAAERKTTMQYEGEREGKPSKRDRREIGRVRGRD